MSSSGPVFKSSIIGLTVILKMQWQYDDIVFLLRAVEWSFP